MAVILIGNDTTDRPNSKGAGTTWIDGNYQADGSGILTTVNFRLASAGNVVVGVFEHLGNNVFYCRATFSPGYCGAGVHSYTDLSLPIKLGDFLGINAGGGTVDNSDAEGSGYWQNSAGLIGATYYMGTTWSATKTLSLGGSGVTQAQGDSEAEIVGQLNLLRDDYLPSVRAWLYENVGYLSFFDYILAGLVYNGLNAGAPGTLYTGPTLQQIKDVLGTPYQTTLADQNTALAQSFSDQHTEQNGVLEAIAADLAEPTGHLALSEGNILTALQVTEDRIQGTDDPSIADALAAIGSGSNADVLSALQSHDTNLNDARNLILAAIALVGTVSAALDAISAVGDAVTAVGSTVDTIDTVIDAVDTALGALRTVADLTKTDSTDILTAVGGLPTLSEIEGVLPEAAGFGAPVWPGIAGVTLGTTVALTNGLHLTTAMDGVIIAITTPPSKTGTMVIGDATFDYREGQVAFENDQGDIEMWQYLGFRNALYTPRSMQHAAGARFRVLAGAEGTVTPWTVTP